MPCTTLNFRPRASAGKVSSERVVRLAFEQRARNDAADSIDSRTTWPTRRIRWCMRLPMPIDGSG
jgi:hypothetical protein